jgi:hypothetical protein
MKVHSVLVSVTAIALISSVAVAVAAKKTPHPIGPLKVSFAGCPIMHDIEGGCLTVKSHGQTYLLNSANPRPDPAKGLGIAGTGIWHSGTVTTCMMGKPLSSIKWHYTRQRCSSSSKE